MIASADSIWPMFDPTLGHRSVTAVVEGFVRHYASTAAFQRVWEEVTQLEPTAADLRTGSRGSSRRPSRLASLRGRRTAPSTGPLDLDAAARALAAMVDRTCFLTFVLDQRPGSAGEEVTGTLTQLWSNALQLERR